MAELAVAAGGAAVTTALGLGPAPGWVIGSIVGALIFGAEEQGQPLQIGDRTIASSAYGTAIPEAFGLVRLAGNVIWALDIEVREGSSAGKSAGETSSGVTQIAVASFAVAFAKGPASFLSKIWADGNLIHDYNDPIVGQGLTFRIYLGEETQSPDPAIVAAKGVNAVPAFLDLVYVVFEDLPLGPYGNRPPSISAEIAYDASVVTVEDSLELLAGGTIDGDFFAQKFDLGFFHVVSTGGSGTVLRKCIFSSGPSSDFLELSNILLQNEFDGPLIPNSTHPVRVFTDWEPLGGPYTQLPIGRFRDDNAQTTDFGFGAGGVVNEPDKFVNTDSGAIIDSDDGLGAVRQYLATSGVGGQLGLLESATNALTFVWLNDFGRDCIVVAGGETQLYSFAWFITEDLELFRLSVARTSAPVPDVLFESVHDFSDIGVTRSGVWYDQTDGGVIVAADTGVLAKYDTIAENRQWTSEVVYDGTTLHISHSTSVVQNRKLAFVHDLIYSLDSLTGEVVSTSAPPRPYSQLGFQCYWGYADCLIVFAEGEVRRWCLNRIVVAPDTIPVGPVLEEIADLAGVSSVDTSLVAGTLTGFTVTRVVTAKEALEVLSRLFSIESRVSLDTLHFIDKDQGFDQGVIPETALVDTGEVVRESRADLNEIPSQVELAHIDSDRDYQKNVQRFRLPEELVPSGGDRVQLEFPVAISATLARKLAEVILMSSLDERVSASFTLPREYLYVEPTDRLSLEMVDGRTLLLRVVQTTINPEDFSVDVDAVGTDITIFTPSDIQGDSGDPNQPPGTVNPTTFLFLGDLPLLLDSQDTGRSYSIVYFGLSGYGQRWNLGSLVRSKDGGLSWSTLGFSGIELLRGYASTILGDTNHPFATDRDNFVDIRLLTGDDSLLETVTTLQLLNGANVAVIGDEVIQFRDVSNLGGGVFRLSYLLRGRRGTEVYTSGHQFGDFFALLNSELLQVFPNELSDIGNQYIYKPVGEGQSIPEALSSFGSLSGADLLPYEPAQLSVLNDVPLNQRWIISWVRRTRVGGEWLDFVDVPLSEDTEEYDLEIYETGGALVRTVSGLTSPQYLYSLLVAQADFGGTVPATWDLKVYQVSAQVGRGRSVRRTFTTGV